MKRNRYIGFAMMAASMLAATSCTDYNDYNETPVDESTAGSQMSQTLWENILQNPQLTNFAELIKKTGFETELSTPRSLTVWAPVNGSFSMADYENLSKEDLLTKFVKGHVAKYSHVATGEVNERVHMLSEKSFLFEGNGTYTFDGLALDGTHINMPSSNGLMHLMKGVAPFRPNLYEYLKENEGIGIDSLRNQFMRYEETYFDENASVKGPMVDGVQTYVDSVVITYNSLINDIGARIQNEDSSYTFIMPTDEAFMKLYNRVEPYYNLLSAMKVQDVEKFTSASGTNTKNADAFNVSYMTDSLVRRVITRNLVYSNTNLYNRWLVDDNVFNDTVRSTTGNKFSNPDDIVNRYMVGAPIELSNGYARIVDSLAFYPWETYNPERTYSPRNNLAALFPAAAMSTSQSVPDSLLPRIFGEEAEGMSNYRYAWISPGGDRTKPDFFISLPNVLSTTYNFYVVFLPTALPALGGETRPNLLNFQLNYTDAKNNIVTYNFSKPYADALLSGGALPDVPTAVNMSTAFANDPEKADTVFIGRFTFPVSYASLGNEYYPTLKVSSPISVFDNTQLATYSRDVRIGAILLRPQELDEFEAKNK